MKSYPMNWDISQALGKAAENQKNYQACPENRLGLAVPPAPFASSLGAVLPQEPSAAYSEKGCFHGLWFCAQLLL